ncbi:MAG TPA: hypothetical protein PKW35_16035, partial [Nannocystaceae bacterium]|nr:hypothetical protein [Nannocystaceae bacterium]
DHRHLCAARDLALAVLRDHLRQDHRLEFELRLQALDRALTDQGDPAVLCTADTGLLTTSTPRDVRCSRRCGPPRRRRHPPSHPCSDH